VKELRKVSGKMEVPKREKGVRQEGEVLIEIQAKKRQKY
jgi:hypothetical protein